jgi:diguanylate cyclase (GGDEF)-like protein
MFVLLLAWLRDRLETEKRLARTDPLTGLANRRAFLDAARVELERARRLGHSITLACFDLDGFKTVNDRLGHRAGDELLCLVATRLREAIRVFDLPARLGGDEFMLLLPGLGADGAPRFLERLKAEVIDPLRARWSVSWSCGAATYLSAPFAVEEMIASADRLMYAVKGSGKDGVLHEVDPTPDANPGSAAERLPSIEDASPAGVADAPQTER